MTSDSRDWTRTSLTHLGAWLGGLAAAFAIAVVALRLGGEPLPAGEIVWLVLWFGPPAFGAALVLCAVELVLLWAMSRADGLPRAFRAAVPAVAVYAGSVAIMIGYVALTTESMPAPPEDDEAPVELAMYRELREAPLGSDGSERDGAYAVSAGLALIPAAAVFGSHFALATRHDRRRGTRQTPLGDTDPSKSTPQGPLRS